MRMTSKWVVAGVLFVSMVAFAGAKDKKAPLGDDLLKEYLAVQVALAGDGIAGVVDAAKRLEKTAASVGAKDKALAASLKAQALALGKAKDLAAAREAFKPLSESVVNFVQKHYQGERALGIYHCSMANGRWVQAEAETRNPYYGAQMLTCGQRVATVGQAAPADTKAEPHDHH